MAWNQITIRQIIQSVLLFLIVVVGGAIAIVGEPISENAKAKAVGVLQVEAFPTGLSLFQNTRGIYFALSPYNDYYVTTQGKRITFFPKNYVDQKQYVTSLNTDHIEDLLSTFSYYLTIDAPKITFWAKNEKITYISHVADDTMSISRTLTTPTRDITSLGSTIAYHSEDFLFDPAGAMYEYQNPGTTQAFEEAYNMQLTASDGQLVRPVPGKTLIMISPYVSGVIVIEAHGTQTLSVNRNAKLIEIVQPVQPGHATYTTTLEIRVYSSLSEALAHI